MQKRTVYDIAVFFDFLFKMVVGLILFWFVLVSFELIWGAMFSVSCLFRLEIKRRPDLLKATVFDGMVFFLNEPPPYPARNTITQGGNQASYLELSFAV